MSRGFCIAYTPTPELEKLSELRAKTDRQLLGLIHSRLEFGLNLTALAEETYSDGSQDHAEQLLGRAEQAAMEVKQLLPVLTEDQYRSVGKQLKDLQEALDRLSRLDSARIRTTEIKPLGGIVPIPG
jgi:hypothetical protein